MATVACSADHIQPAFRLPPVPRTVASRSTTEDVIFVTTPRRRPRRRREHGPGLELAFAGGTLAILAIFALNLVDRIQPVTPDQPRQHTRRNDAASDRIVALKGRGGVGTPPADSQTPVTAGAGTANRRSAAPPTPQHEVDQIVNDAITACREGRFDAADDLARTIMRAAAKDPRGPSIRVLVAYLRQYPALADEAIDRMNGAVEVDLGRRHGTGMFVERDGDTLVFFAEGRHVRLSVREFKALDTVSFQVTRKFLENGRQPANDLILGAVHFVLQLDETGAYQNDGETSRRAARDRWESVARGHERNTADHARALLPLLNNFPAKIARSQPR